MLRKISSMGWKIFFATILLGMSVSSAPGQSSTAAITGTVEDTTNAGIPGATVRLISTDRGTENVATTNEQGKFAFPSVLPGHFKLQIERDGFDTTYLTDITLNVSENRYVIIRMKVGGSRDTVTVNGNAVTIDPLTSSIGAVHDERAVRDLPLNTRNFSQLITLSGGSVPDNTQTSGLSISSGRGTTTAVVNGISTNSNNYRVDTLEDTDNHNATSQLLYPPVEAIQEFRVISSVPNAEFGNLGATINVIYKSGAREFHGDVFEFLRNSKYLDAKNYFDPKGPIKPFHFNNYGATIGGPVILPFVNKNHEKLFFFFSWEGARSSQSLTYVSTVPLPAFLNGDFSAYPLKIYNPNTTVVLPGGTISRTQFAGNQIPTGMMNQTGINLLKLFPAPQTSALVNNYTYTPASTNKHDYFDVRIDSPITPHDSIFLRISRQNSTIYTPGSLPAPAIGNQGDYTNKFPVWQVAAGYTKVFSQSLINEAHAGFTRLKISAVNANYGQYLSDQLGIPGTNVVGNPNTSGLSVIALSDYGSLGDWSYTPASWSNNNFQINDSLTWVHHSHTFKFGGEFLRRQENFFEGFAVRGSFAFGPTYTTNPAAGGSSGNSIADLLLGAPTSGTMNFPIGTSGRRRSDSALYVQDTWQVNHRLTLNLGLRWDYLPHWSEVLDRFAYFEIPAGGIYNVGSPQIPWKTGVKPRYNDFGPRVGFTYSATEKTLVRGAVGIFHGPINGATNITGDVNPPYAGSTSYSNDASNFSGARLISDGFVRPAQFSALGAPLVGIDPFMKDQNAVQYNLGIQQVFPGDMLFTMSYVGTRGRSLMQGPNLNQATPGAGSVAARRPYPLYGNVNVIQSSGKSNFDSLQTTLERNLGKNVQFLISHTWSHALDNGAGIPLTTQQNPYNMAAEYGNANYNVPQRLILSGVFALPYGKGMRFGANSSALVNTVLGGWRLSTITSLYSGLPFTPTTSVNTLNIGGGTQRPNRVGSGYLAKGQRNVKHWFDTSAFVSPAQYQFGNSKRNILQGPGTKTVDMSLFKTFILGSNVVRNFELRADAFNITNTPQFNNPNAAIGSPTAGVISSAGSPVTFQRTSRQIQISGKLHF